MDSVAYDQIISKDFFFFFLFSMGSPSTFEKNYLIPFPSISIYPTLQSHFGFINFMNMLLLQQPNFYTIKHNWSYSNLQNFTFNLIGTLKSYSTPNILLHFIQPILILLVVSCITDSKSWLKPVIKMHATHSSSLQLVQGKKSDKRNYHINSSWEGNVKVKSETCEGK